MPRDFTDFQAPWEVYPDIPCGSIHWRMGPGEDAMGEWWPRFRALSQEQRLAYGRTHLGSSEWSKWLNRVIEDLSKETDKVEVGRLVRQETDEVIISCTFETPDTAEVKTVKLQRGQTKEGHIFKFTRSKEGWELQKALTRSWSV